MDNESKSGVCIPGICDECFKEQKPADHFYCEHDKRLAVYHDGCWETTRDVEPGSTSGMGRFETIRPILTLSQKMSALEPKVAVKER
jgi:hypothetical protein